MGVGYADAISRGLVGMFNSEGQLVISATVKLVNDRPIILNIDPWCYITKDDVYAWKLLIQQYRAGVNDLGLMPTHIHAVDRGSATIQELEQVRKKVFPTWHAASYIVAAGAGPR